MSTTITVNLQSLAGKNKEIATGAISSWQSLRRLD
jgi:hypothetical protein